MNKTRFVALMLAILMLFPFCITSVCFAEGEEEDTSTPNITSGNVAVAYCIDEEQFLYTDRLDERVAPAVATKLVNAMVVMDILKENGLTLEDEVTVTQVALDNAYESRYGDISFQLPVMILKAGKSYSARDLLSSVLVVAANDAAAALACHYGEKYLGGGLTEFVGRMNEKVASLGLTNTKFTNPTGFDSPEQYTTPREVALIASAFYQYNELVTLSDVESFRFNGEQLVRSRNFLKNEFYVGGYLNKNAISLIAGQLTKKGNYCLIAASQKEGKTYIYVVMCATGITTTEVEPGKFIQTIGEGNAYVDMNKLISWTKSAFKMIKIATTGETISGELRVHLGEKTHVILTPAQNVEKLVPIDDDEVTAVVEYDTSLVYKMVNNDKEYDTINAPVSAGQRVGKITYYSTSGRELASVDLVAKEGVPVDALKAMLDSVKQFMKKLAIVIYIVIGIIAAYIIFLIVVKVNRAKKKQQSKPKPRPQRTVQTTKKQPIQAKPTGKRKK